MNNLLYFAIGLILLIGLAHSLLGERYILMRLFRRNDLPRILGSSHFTRQTLRFAWHLTTIAWYGYAAILWQMTDKAATISIVTIIGIVFLIHGATALIASRARHLSWIVFLAIGGLSLYAGIN